MVRTMSSNLVCHKVVAIAMEDISKHTRRQRTRQTEKQRDDTQRTRRGWGFTTYINVIHFVNVFATCIDPPLSFCLCYFLFLLFFVCMYCMSLFEKVNNNPTTDRPMSGQDTPFGETTETGTLTTTAAAAATAAGTSTARHAYRRERQNDCVTRRQDMYVIIARTGIDQAFASL